MKNTQVDRRSQRTKQLLSAALMELMLEKRYSEITVQDIIDRANVGRSTFYAHYLDKEDLLVSDVSRVFDLLSQRIRERGNDSAFKHVELTIMFEHIQAHVSLYKALVKGGGITLVYSKGRERLRHNIELHLQEMMPQSSVPTVPLALVADYVAGALLNLITWWLEHDLPFSPAQMNTIFLQLIGPGVQTSLQLPD